VRVTVCGLGPGGVDLVTEQTRAAIADHADEVSFVRTRRHPSAELMARATSFDSVYDDGASLDEVYRTIAQSVGDAARASGSALYAVPGSPLVLERAVHLLRTVPDLEVDVLPAVSFLDAAWSELGIDPVEASVRLVDGHVFAESAAGERGPLLVAHAHAKWVLSDIKLALDVGPEQKVVVLQRLGTDDADVFEVEWPDLDRSFEPDHLTSLYLPEVVAPVAVELQRSVALMQRLRRECPWDQEQTHHSLRPYLIEEAYETLEAVDAVIAGVDGAYDHLEEELGDLWFQILFHSELAAEAGAFTVADVARTAHDKLVGRHPHVFGEVAAHDAATVASNWEAIKKVEKGRSSVMDGIPTALPALLYATKVVKKAVRAGAPRSDREIDRVLADGLRPVVAGDADAEAALGSFLLAAVAVAEAAGVDAESALRSAADRARDRFRASESDQYDHRWILG
jgi:tetrapyrrole methylase family protein/MazG family protein